MPHPVQVSGWAGEPLPPPCGSAGAMRLQAVVPYRPGFGPPERQTLHRHPSPNWEERAIRAADGVHAAPVAVLSRNFLARMRVPPAPIPPPVRRADRGAAGVPAEEWVAVEQEIPPHAEAGLSIARQSAGLAAAPPDAATAPRLWVWAPAAAATCSLRPEAPPEAKYRLPAAGAVQPFHAALLLRARYLAQ